MTRYRIKTAHGTYLRAGDTGEVNQADNPAAWEEFDIEEIGSNPTPVPPPNPTEDEITGSIIILANAPDVLSWPITSKITRVIFTSNQLCIEHTKSGKWPVIGDPTKFEGNPWVFAQLGSNWYGATYEWLRPGQTCKNITADNIGAHTKQHPIENWTPRYEELVGLMVSTPARDNQRTSNERSNIIVVKWGVSQ